MSNRVPNTLTNETSERYIISIRLWPGGFSFAGFIPAEKDSFFYEEICLDPTKPYIKAIKDCFFDIPYLTFHYKKAFILLADINYTLAPESIFLEKEALTLFNFVSSRSGDKVLHNLVNELDVEIIFGLQHELYEFFSREIIEPRFVHVIKPVLSFCLRNNLGCFYKQLYVIIHENLLDAVCLDKGALRFVNSFHYSDPDDIVYYILYIWKQVGLDQVDDELFLFAEPGLFHQLMEILQHYLLKINSVETLSSFSTAKEAPFDVKTLFECEL